MGTPVKELASGTIDGVNLVFEASTDYRPGSLVPYLNGLAAFATKASEGPGRLYTLTDAPRVGDQVSHYFVTVT